MTSPTTTITALARRFALEVDMNPGGVADWQPCPGIEEFKPVRTTRKEKDESYDDAGAERQAITGSTWSIDIKLIHRTASDGITFNTVQEYLRTQSEQSNALAGEVHVRWYDRNGSGEAWDGRCLVDWTPDGGNGGARDTVTVKLMGQGDRASITNPNASALPAITALSPATGAAAGGELITIKGRKLTGATAVKFGATDADGYTIVDDTRIVAIAPAHAAATVDVAVTTPAGTNTNTAADDYIYT